MGKGDWVEGTAFVAMVGAAFCLVVCRLCGLTLGRAATDPAGSGARITAQ
jgi:hypothetical protein